MKLDGSQYQSKGVIANYIKHYMRFYGLHHYADPFCGFCSVATALQKSWNISDGELKLELTDYNPYIIAIMKRLWRGEDIPETISKDRYDAIRKEFKQVFKANKNYLNGLDGYENWEVGCALILGTLHQNITKGYIGDEFYATNIKHVKENIKDVPYPDKLEIADYTEVYMGGYEPRLIYCDFPEPTAKNIFPFGMFFNREEFFENYSRKWEDGRNVVIYSSKYFPDNGRYEIIYQAGQQYLYIGKKWYVEDILNVAKANKRKGPPAVLQREERIRKGRKILKSESRKHKVQHKETQQKKQRKKTLEWTRFEIRRKTRRRTDSL